MKRGLLMGALTGLAGSFLMAVVVTLVAVYESAEDNRTDRQAEDTLGAPVHPLHRRERS